MIKKEIRKEFESLGYNKYKNMKELKLLIYSFNYVKPYKRWRYLFDDVVMETYMKCLISDKTYTKRNVLRAVLINFIRSKNVERGLTTKGTIPLCKCKKKIKLDNGKWLSVEKQWRLYLKNNNIWDYQHKYDCKGNRSMYIQNDYQKNTNNIENSNGTWWKNI